MGGGGGDKGGGGGGIEGLFFETNFQDPIFQ